MDLESGLPLAFHFTGFNVILGSHYDEYIFDYLEIDTAVPESSIFNAPTTSMECVILETDDGDDGGPTKSSGGATIRPLVSSLETPLSDIAAMLPGGGAKRASKFVKWAAKYGKAYEAFEERFHRASLYHATEKYVNSMNRKRLSYWLEANHMADWTAAEKKALRGRLHTPKGTVIDAAFQHKPTGKDLPENVDWVAAGAVTSPKDQGTCGSCWSVQHIRHARAHLPTPCYKHTNPKLSMPALLAPPSNTRTHKCMRVHTNAGRTAPQAPPRARSSLRPEN